MGGDATVGGTILYNNVRSVDPRVRVGAEPARTVVWDLDLKAKFDAPLLTRAVDALPLLKTAASSDLSFHAEVAQSRPNLNTKGRGYIDDFEGSEQPDILSVFRSRWTPASRPLAFDGEDRGRMTWYNPYNRIPRTEIWPRQEDQVEASENKADVLVMELTPLDGDPESWGGLMSTWQAGVRDFSQSKFLEVWVRGTEGVLHIDLGSIDEDWIENGVIDTEDIPYAGSRTGDGVVSKEEDVGIDGRDDAGELAFYLAEAGVGTEGLSVEEMRERFRDLPQYEDRDAGDPEGDNWHYDSSRNRNDYSRINGTEGQPQQRDRRRGSRHRGPQQRRHPQPQQRLLPPRHRPVGRRPRSRFRKSGRLASLQKAAVRRESRTRRLAGLEPRRVRAPDPCGKPTCRGSHHQGGNRPDRDHPQQLAGTGDHGAAGRHAARRGQRGELQRHCDRNRQEPYLQASPGGQGQAPAQLESAGTGAVPRAGVRRPRGGPPGHGYQGAVGKVGLHQVHAPEDVRPRGLLGDLSRRCRFERDRAVRALRTGQLQLLRVRNSDFPGLGRAQRGRSRPVADGTAESTPGGRPHRRPGKSGCRDRHGDRRSRSPRRRSGDLPGSRKSVDAADQAPGDRDAQPQRPAQLFGATVHRRAAPGRGPQRPRAGGLCPRQQLPCRPGQRRRFGRLAGGELSHHHEHGPQAIGLPDVIEHHDQPAQVPAGELGFLHSGQGDLLPQPEPSTLRSQLRRRARPGGEAGAEIATGQGALRDLDQQTLEQELDHPVVVRPDELPHVSDPGARFLPDPSARKEGQPEHELQLQDAPSQTGLPVSRLAAGFRAGLLVEDRAAFPADHRQLYDGRQPPGVGDPAALEHRHDFPGGVRDEGNLHRQGKPR